MQTRGLHKNLYKPYTYARTQECLDHYRQLYEEKAHHWRALKAEGVSDVKCQEFVAISRATYYRYCQVLKKLAHGIMEVNSNLEIEPVSVGSMKEEQVF